jgi:hypothetical protein
VLRRSRRTRSASVPRLDVAAVWEPEVDSRLRSTDRGHGGRSVRLGFANLSVSPGDHIGHFYRTRDEWASLAIPYLKAGLEAEQKCVYVVGSADEVRTLKRLLEASGVNADGAIGRDQLSVLEAPNDPDVFRQWVDEALADASSRFNLLRWGGDMTWAQRKMPSVERLMKLEAQCDRWADQPAVFLCQYDLKSFMGNVIMDALHTHALCIVGTNLAGNSFHKEPAVFLDELRSRQAAS